MVIGFEKIDDFGQSQGADLADRSLVPVDCPLVEPALGDARFGVAQLPPGFAELGAQIFIAGRREDRDRASQRR